MGYIIGRVQTYCGFEGTHRITCVNCRTDNTWQQLSISSYRCIRCRCNISIDENMLNKIQFADSQIDLEEREIKHEENN